MTSTNYTNIGEFHSIVANKLGESVSLEYKSSKVLAERKTADICKAVTALANSVGGHFLIGIESSKHGPEKLDGGVEGPSRADWLHQIINGHTYPSVEGVEITELRERTGTYYTLYVPPSPIAPHQSDDHKYYKRRGSHSEPMEHYEIEDVRNRPKREIAPLCIELFADGYIAYLHFRNGDATDSVENIKCSITPNFDLKINAGISALGKRGLRQLRPQAERFFFLDSFMDMLGRASEAELHIDTSYVFRGITRSCKVSFYLEDYSHSAIMKTPAVEKLEDLTKKLEGISGAVKNLGAELKTLTRISDATGLRISERSFAKLRREPVRHDPSEFDWQGYKVMLEISTDEAIQLYQIFHTFGSPEDKRKSFEALPPELAEKFRARFNVPFE